MPALARRPALGLLAVFIAATVASGAGTPSGQSATASPTGTLELRASLALVSELGACPPGVAADACAPRTGTGLVPGLGGVTGTYAWSFRIGPPTCPAGVGKPLATNGRLVVAGKGEISFALADGSRCIDIEPLRNEPQSYTITGGTGPYARASGSGTVERSVSAGAGTETWAGTLVVPGLEFDLTPPTLSGTAPKTVRAPKGVKRVRVTYRVTASDAVDGPVPATCLPRSGSRFPIGRTVVRCSATDSSANTSTGRLIVTVKPRR
jgi:hypothetical protein